MDTPEQTPLSPEAYVHLRADLAAVGIVLPVPISGGALIPLAAMLIPLIPGLVSAVTSIVNAVRQDPGVPEDQQAKLDDLARRLDATAAAVAALEIRTVGDTPSA